MNMNNNINLKHLSQISKETDIVDGSFTIYPGQRCPIPAITNLLENIKDAVFLVVGTSECTYYNKNIAYAHHETATVHKVWSYAIDNKEVIFGFGQKLLEALEEISQTGAKAIYVASTCVPQVIGEDFDGIVHKANTQYDAQFIHIPAAHFNCYNPMPAQRDTLASLHHFMKPQAKKPLTFNLLGTNAHRLRNSELLKILDRHKVTVHKLLPCAMSVSDLEDAPAAAVSIVTDYTALPLAEKMFERFGTPFVLFPQYLLPQDIQKGYLDIGKHLNLDLQKDIDLLYACAQNKVNVCNQTLKDITFATTYLDADALCYADFLTQLGMQPVYLEVDYWLENSTFKHKILSKGYDPVIGRSLNTQTQSTILSQLHPDMVIGMPTRGGRKKIGSSPKTLNPSQTLLGFECSIHLMETLMQQITQDRQVHSIGTV